MIQNPPTYTSTSQAAQSQGDRHDLLEPNALERSYQRLDRIIRTQGKTDFSFPGNPAATAVVRVLREIGLDLNSSKIEIERIRSAESIEDCCRLFDARTRSIVLPTQWWLSDHGHLIGFTSAGTQSVADGADDDGETEGGPVALISQTGGYYLLIRPDTGEAVRVTEAIAETLRPVAVELLPALPPKLNSIRALARFLLPAIKTELKWTALIGALTGLIGALLPIATGFVIDTLIPGAEAGLLFQVGIGLGVAAVLMTLMNMVSQRMLLRINGRSELLTDAALWDHVLKLPAATHREYTSGDLEQRMAGVDAIRGAIVSIVLSTALTAVFSVFYLILLLQYDLRLAAFAIVYVAVLVALSFGIAIYMKTFYRRQAEISGWLSGYIFQILQAIVKLRSAGAEQRAMARWADKYADYSAISLTTQRITGQFTNFFALLTALGTIGLYATAHYYASDTLSAGTFIAFLAAFGGFQGAFQGLSGALLALIAVTPQWDRAKPLLEADRENSTGGGDPGVLSGAIELTNVDFAYEPGRPILKGITLKIEPGEQVALVGPSGSGKSTIIRLLLALDTPDSGSITYDNQDLHGLDLSLLRRQLGVVTQTGRIAAGSIMDNVRGATNLSHEECLVACLSAGLENDLKTFSMGLNTPLTEGGATLSGGQRQRLLIARALVGKPRILIFDEATSALDNRTQATVTASLARLDITRIVVAHRLSTVVSADRICVIDDGRLVEQGTYSELMAKGGLFADLAKRQLVLPAGSA